MDELQASVRPFLKELGFQARARAFNRTTFDGITQVIEFQLARFDPPGTQYVGFRQNLYGKFTVNVGVYVPELHKYGTRPDQYSAGHFSSLQITHPHEWSVVSSRSLDWGSPNPRKKGGRGVRPYASDLTGRSPVPTPANRGYFFSDW